MAFGPPFYDMENIKLHRVMYLAGEDGSKVRYTGYFRNKALAMTAAKGINVRGTDGHVEDIDVTIYDSIEEFEKSESVSAVKKPARRQPRKSR